MGRDHSPASEYDSGFVAVRLLKDIYDVLAGQSGQGAGGSGGKKKGGWSQSFNLNTASTAAPSTQGQGGMQVLFQDAGIYTVQFDVIPPNVNGTIAPYNAVANVTWVTQGNQVTRQVTVGKGISITGVGEGVNVTVTDNTPKPSIDKPWNAGVGYVVTASVSKGARPTTGQPPVLNTWTKLQTLNPSTNLIVPVPQGVGVSSFRGILNGVGAGAGGAVFVQMDDGSVGGVYRYYDLSMYRDFVSIPSGVTELKIINSDAANQYNVSGDWGIDG